MAYRFDERAWLRAFMQKFVRRERCWVWTGSKPRGEYGMVRRNGQMIYAHRAAYEAFIGPIPEGLQLDHLCRNRSCVNPAHLEPVTRSENILRGRLPNSEKSHCPQGHIYDERNTYWATRRDGRRNRMCRRCTYERKAARRRVLAAAARGA